MKTFKPLLIVLSLFLILVSCEDENDTFDSTLEDQRALEEALADVGDDMENENTDPENDDTDESDDEDSDSKEDENGDDEDGENENDDSEEDNDDTDSDEEENNDDANDDEDENMDDEDGDSDPMEDSESDFEIDCSTFDGLRNYRNRVVGAIAFTIIDIDQDAVVWTVNGVVVDNPSPRVLLLSSFVDSAGTVEICYSATSETCGVLEDCVTVDFQGN